MSAKTRLLYNEQICVATTEMTPKTDEGGGGIQFKKPRLQGYADCDKNRRNNGDKTDSQKTHSA